MDMPSTSLAVFLSLISPELGNYLLFNKNLSLLIVGINPYSISDCVLLYYAKIIPFQ